MKRIRLTEYLVNKKAASLSREIPKDFKYNNKKLKHLKNILHNVSVALGTLMSACNEFSKFKGPEISPDGFLGGKGFIMSIKDIKESLNGCIRNLSDVADSLADEFTNPKWNVKDDAEVKELIKEKDKIEEKVEEGTPPEEDISPDDVTDTPKEEEPKEETPKEAIDLSDLVEGYESKTSSEKKSFSEAVKDNLLRFYLKK